MEHTVFSFLLAIWQQIILLDTTCENNIILYVVSKHSFMRNIVAYRSIVQHKNDNKIVSSTSVCCTSWSPSQ